MRTEAMRASELVNLHIRTQRKRGGRAVGIFSPTPAPLLPPMRLALLASLLFASAASAQTHYEITVPQGRIVVRLFDDTPLHRDNFRQRAAAGQYDSTTFHRVIAGFMVQGGDPNTRDDDPSNDGLDSPGLTIPAEIGRPHVRGALAAARQPDQLNPTRASSPSQFYLVQGRPVSPAEIPQMTDYVRRGSGDAAFAFDSTVVARYTREGGAPYLDDQYTVFGEIVEGLDVLDAIAAIPTDRMDRPATRVPMAVRPLTDYVPIEEIDLPAADVAAPLE